MKDSDYRYGRRVTIVGIAGNIAVAVFKYVCGVAGNSGALIADAVHSISDIIATVAVLFGIKLSSKPVDKNHPYGHELNPFQCEFHASVLGMSHSEAFLH